VTARALLGAAALALLAGGACAKAEASSPAAPDAAAAGAVAAATAGVDAFPSETGMVEGDAKPHHIPSRTQLPCFQCHEFDQFQKGPPFPHDTDEHRSVGHCSLCHAALGHHGIRIDTRPCLSCHDEADLKEKIPGLPTGDAAAAPAEAPAPPPEPAPAK
jgi:hypothetical protein